MRDDPQKPEEGKLYNQTSNIKTTNQIESNMIHELKQQRDYLFKLLVDVQKAIDAVNLIR